MTQREERNALLNRDAEIGRGLNAYRGPWDGPEAAPVRDLLTQRAEVRAKLERLAVVRG